MASTYFGLRPSSGSLQLSLVKVILILKHSVGLRRYLLCGGVAACPGMACVLCALHSTQPDGPGIESRLRGRDFLHCPDRPWGPPSLLYNGYRVLPGGKLRPGRDADPSAPSNAVVKKGYSYTSTPPMGRRACTEPQCLYKGALYLSPFGVCVRLSQSVDSWCCTA